MEDWRNSRGQSVTVFSISFVIGSLTAFVTGVAGGSVGLGFLLGFLVPFIGTSYILLDEYKKKDTLIIDSSLPPSKKDIIGVARTLYGISMIHYGVGGITWGPGDTKDELDKAQEHSSYRVSPAFSRLSQRERQNQALRAIGLTPPIEKVKGYSKELDDITRALGTTPEQLEVLGKILQENATRPARIAKFLEESKRSERTD
jgi:hypothetical protein